MEASAAQGCLGEFKQAKGDLHLALSVDRALPIARKSLAERLV